mgnify:CR=1 FL=1
MRSSGLALPKTVVHKANARKSARSLIAETGKHGAEGRAMTSPTFPPTILAIQEVKDLRDPAGEKRLRGATRSVEG